MKYQIWYHVPGKRYDYTDFEEWENVVEFVKKAKDSVDNGICFEIKTSASQSNDEKVKT